MKDIVKFFATQAVMSFNNGTEFSNEKLQTIWDMQDIEGIVQFINKITDHVEYNEDTSTIYDNCLEFILS